MAAVIRTLEGTGLVHREWLRMHTRTFDMLTFAEQVQLMALTDVFVSTHGAAAMNAIFMRPGSVFVDVLNGPYMEYFFSTPLHEAGVRALYVQAWEAEQFSGCGDVPAECVWGPRADRGVSGDGAGGEGEEDEGVLRSLEDGARLQCLALRSCSVTVDLAMFRSRFIEAHHHVLTVKFAT